VHALKEERLDAAVIRSTSSDAAGLTLDPLLEERMAAALPAGHRLAGRGGKAALADFAEETFVFYRRPTGPGLYDSIVAACLAAGFSPKVGQEAPRMASTLSLVASGLGVSIVPAAMQRMNVEGVAFVRLKGTRGLVAPLLLATRRRDRSILAASFRREVRAAAEAARR
jgi:DNA-binding transcriptional LysR family regulator